MGSNLSVWCSFLVLAIVSTSAHGQSHPLDSLSPNEIKQVDAIIKSSTLFSSRTLAYHYLTLHEPNKDRVLSWLSDPKRRKAPPREAFVIARANETTFEIIVSLARNAVVSSRVHAGAGFPTINPLEQEQAIALPLVYQPFLDSLEKRCINVTDVLLIVYTEGWFGEKGNERRTVRLLAYHAGGSVNVWVRPIEEITIRVDLDEMVIVEYSDKEILPVPKAQGTEYRASELKHPCPAASVNPINVVQPLGPSFNITGQLIRWANWDFHLRFDSRAGVIISLASLFDVDLGKERLVLYKGMISELFVPYMDPTRDWYYRAFFDEGDYGLGFTTVSLQNSTDCPSNAVFIDGYYANQDGTPEQVPNAICIFERYTGDIAWRHSETELQGNISEVRREIALVIRMVVTSGNYDYVLDWELTRSGSIRVVVSLTGILLSKATEYTNVTQIKGDPYGTLVAENTIAPNHDHYFTYYLDLDVDGQENSFVKNRRMFVRSDGTTPRMSYWTGVEETAETELDARMQTDRTTDLIIVNPNKETKLGDRVGYRLIPAPPSGPVFPDDDLLGLRAAFTRYQVWVTPYRRSELWAGGLYTDHSHGTDTLYVWTNRNRNIKNKDIVLRHTFGLNHIPTQEEYPVMPTARAGFELRPHNFFDRNPILTIKP